MTVSNLYIDIETFSSVDIKTDGVYKYVNSVDFEILIVCFAFDDGPVLTVDLAQGGRLPKIFIDKLLDPKVEKHAVNAIFERLCFRAYGYDVPPEQWRCTAIKAAYCGLLLSLAGMSEILELGENGKKPEGLALIKLFSCPVKPTKSNGFKTRNMPDYDLKKWGEYIDYCVYDVIAEREACKRLSAYDIPEKEHYLYALDQRINDRGVGIDLDFATAALAINDDYTDELRQRVINMTGLDNPASNKTFKDWLIQNTGQQISGVAKGDIADLLEKGVPDHVAEVIRMRGELTKTSIKKYVAMINCRGDDGRARGTFQFYGANRTGRWAGRLIQLQNLPRNYFPDIDEARALVLQGHRGDVELTYGNVSGILSQLIRTGLVAQKGSTFAIADFSAIEARVIAWLANERWRLEVFETHGKIYEASASLIFGVPMDKIKKGSDLREKGKVAELAFGYGGSIGAFKQFGGDSIASGDDEIKTLVGKWRDKSPRIVAFWRALENAALKAVGQGKEVVLTDFKNITFDYDGTAMTILLPSGRKLVYWKPVITTNKWGNKSIKYRGMDQETKAWGWVDTYGGKLAENITQAVARDCLAEAMIRIDNEGIPIVMHVHDEVVAEVKIENAVSVLQQMYDLMAVPIDFAPGLKLTADGYITPHYKKD